MGVRIDFLEQGLVWLQRHFERFVILFGVGIALYFYLPLEPKLALVTSALFMTFIGGFYCHRFLRSYAPVFWLVCLVLVGVFRAGWHTAAMDDNRLPDYKRSYEVEGWIQAIEKSGPRLRWVVVPSEIDRLSDAETPRLIRVTTFDKAFDVGDGVRFRAELSAPPGPAIPGGYNPSFRAFYQQVGAYGYMVSRPEALEVGPENISGRAKLFIAKIRYGLANRIRASAPEETAGLQAALLTGIRTWIPDEQTEALRDAGLAHILAISGLHMGLIAGSVFGLVMFGLVRIERLARSRDVRKIAAVIGIIAASFYLLLSGASVATQRAYIMTVIVFMALILDRQAFSIRSVAVAAFITLWMHPEALVSPGFQMSFSAVLALVIVYREWDRRRYYRGGRPGLLGRLWNNFTGLTITSFVAGGATSGFAVLHFNRLAAYGLLGNILAMPFFTFWVMPMALVIYVSMFFGFEAWPLWIMGKGIEIILSISVWVAELPGSVHYLPSATGWITALFGLTFIGLCLGRKAIRIGSVVVMVLCCVSLYWRVQPDIRIGENGAVALWSQSETPLLYVDRKNTDKYGRQEFIEAMGLHEAETRSFEGALGACDSLACKLSFQGREILILSDPSEVYEDCSSADLIIVPKRFLGARARRLCAVPIIDQRELTRLGSHSIYLRPDGGLDIKTSNKSIAGRPWEAGWQTE